MWTLNTLCLKNGKIETSDVPNCLFPFVFSEIQKWCEPMHNFLIEIGYKLKSKLLLNLVTSYPGKSSRLTHIMLFFGVYLRLLLLFIVVGVRRDHEIILLRCCWLLLHRPQKKNQRLTDICLNSKPLDRIMWYYYTFDNKTYRTAG